MIRYTCAAHLLTKKVFLALALSVFSLVPVAYALPTEGTSATATIATKGTTMNIGSSTANNVVNWQTYNVAQGETVAYDTHNYLNLVNGGDTSKIYGSITGGGNIYLVNPSGVLFGSTATVNVGSLTVSTRPINQADASGFGNSGANPLGTPAKSAPGDITNIGTLKANSIALEGNNIILKNVANQIDQTTRKTMAADKLKLKAAQNAYIGYQVSGIAQHSEKESDGSTVIYQVSDYANAPTNLVKDNAPTALGYKATKLDGTTNATLFNSMYVSNVYELQSMAYNLSGSYMLTKDIVAKDTKTWNEGKGFIPVGSEKVTSDSTADGIAFTGTFQGLDYEIQGLYINKSAPVDGTAYDDHGLFGYTTNAAIGHVGFDATSQIIGGDEATGSLVGHAGSGTSISYVYNKGSVSGSNKVGGLVGVLQGGSVTNAYNSGDITADGSLIVISAAGFAGGIVGTGIDGTTSSISNCYNTGAVTANVGGYVGGINGHNTGTISDCYNTGKIYAKKYYAGGITGSEYKTGTIFDCYNTGAITADGSTVYGTTIYSYVGGIAGALLGLPASITNAYNTGTITGAAMTGGIVGGDMGGTISKVYNTGKIISSNSRAGGISGYNATTGAVISSALYATTDASGNSINQNLGNNKVGTGVTYADLLKTSTYTANGWTVDSSTCYGKLKL